MRGIKLSPKHGVNPTIPVCFWCGKEKNEVALMGHVGNADKGKDFEMSMHAVIDYEPCEKCAEKMRMGFTVLEATRTPNWVTDVAMQDETYPTGKWVVIKREAAKRMFPELDDSTNTAFIEAGVFDKIFGNVAEG